MPTIQPMSTDIVDFRNFYATPLGAMAEAAIGTALAASWQRLPDERLVGLGYALPWLSQLGTHAERVFAFMPARLGAIRWPAHGPSSTALVDEEELPLADSSVDRVLMVHALEHGENPERMLLEAWRVLSPGGRLVVLTPNRRGLWARFEHTPFGTGRPYSRGQLTNSLREANFTPIRWSDSLHFPPSEKRWIKSLRPSFDYGGRHFWPAFAGVIIVEAEKRLYQQVPATARRARARLVPAFKPQSVSRADLQD